MTAEVNILELNAEPYPDGQRVKVSLVLSSCQESPNVMITITDQKDHPLTSTNIISVFSQENEITMHLPERKRQPGTYQVKAEVYSMEEIEIEKNGDRLVELIQSPLTSSSTSFTVQ
jgi:hypothetical protein